MSETSLSSQVAAQSDELMQLRNEVRWADATVTTLEGKIKRLEVAVNSKQNRIDELDAELRRLRQEAMDFDTMQAGRDHWHKRADELEAEIAVLALRPGPIDVCDAECVHYRNDCLIEHKSRCRAFQPGGGDPSSNDDAGDVDNTAARLFEEADKRRLEVENERLKANINELMKVSGDNSERHLEQARTIGRLEAENERLKAIDTIQTAEIERLEDEIEPLRRIRDVEAARLTELADAALGTCPRPLVQCAAAGKVGCEAFKTQRDRMQEAEAEVERLKRWDMRSCCRCGRTDSPTEYLGHSYAGRHGVTGMMCAKCLSWVRESEAGQ